MNQLTEEIEAMIPSNTNNLTSYEFTYVSESHDPFMFKNGVTTILSQTLNEEEEENRDETDGDEEIGCPMILIPQDNDLKCIAHVSYRIKAGDLYSNVPFNDTESVIINGGLAEGVYNYIMIGFTKTGIHLKAEQTAQWDDINVYHQFE